jgi:hypothetical protein
MIALRKEPKPNAQADMEEGGGERRREEGEGGGGRREKGGGGAGWRCAVHEQRACARSVSSRGMIAEVSTFVVARYTRTHLCAAPANDGVNSIS